MSDTICDAMPHGQQLALTCRNHPALRWSTKNIAPIGCRKIFFDLMGECQGQAECDCPASDLIPVVELKGAWNDTF